MKRKERNMINLEHRSQVVLYPFKSFNIKKMAKFIPFSFCLKKVVQLEQVDFQVDFQVDLQVDLVDLVDLKIFLAFLKDSVKEPEEEVDLDSNLDSNIQLDRILK